MEDFELLAAWREGDRSAGNALFDRHFDSIHRFFVHKVGDDVEDLVQRTFLGCVEARDRFRQLSSFRTFLFAIARNELRMFFRRKKKEAVVDFAVSSLAELSPSPSTLARHKGNTRLLLTALASLPVDQQLALELHYLEGLTGPEIAAILEIPEGTVRSRLRRACERVGGKLVELGGETLVQGAQSDLSRWGVILRDHLGKAS